MTPDAMDLSLSASAVLCGTSVEVFDLSCMARRPQFTTIVYRLCFQYVIGEKAGLTSGLGQRVAPDLFSGHLAVPPGALGASMR